MDQGITDTATRYEATLHMESPSGVKNASFRVAFLATTIVVCFLVVADAAIYLTTGLRDIEMALAVFNPVTVAALIVAAMLLGYRGSALSGVVAALVGGLAAAVLAPGMRLRLTVLNMTPGSWFRIGSFLLIPVLFGLVGFHLKHAERAAEAHKVVGCILLVVGTGLIAIIFGVLGYIVGLMTLRLTPVMDLVAGVGVGGAVGVMAGMALMNRLLAYGGAVWSGILGSLLGGLVSAVAFRTYLQHWGMPNLRAFSWLWFVGPVVLPLILGAAGLHAKWPKTRPGSDSSARESNHG